MDGFIARHDILPFTEVRKLSAKSDARGLRHLAGHVAALAVSGTLVWLATGTWWLLVPAWIVHGVLLNFLFCPLHESIHRTAFRSPRLNDAVANVAGFLLVLGPVYFRYFHFDHHRYTQDPERDPELIEKKPDSPGSWLWYVIGLKSYWWAEVQLMARHALGRVDAPFIPPVGRRAVVREARTFVALYALVAAVSLAAGSWAALTLWVVPIVLGGPSLRLYLMAEHTDLPLTDDMLANTRTTRSNAMVRALAWNMPYHTEHHVFPSIPFHALPAAHDRIAPRHGALSPGYAAFHRGHLARLRQRAATPAPAE